MEKPRVTKQMILQGQDYRLAVQVPGYDVDFVLRPLTGAESAEVQMIIMKELRISGKELVKAMGKKAIIKPADIIKVKELEVYPLIKGSTVSRDKAVAYSLSCDDEEFTSEDVGKLPHGVADILYEHVDKITGLSAGYDDALKFRRGHGAPDTG